MIESLYHFYILNQTPLLYFFSYATQSIANRLNNSKGDFFMSNQTYVNVQEGKRKREELTLPILHFAVADGLQDRVSWIDTLGPKAFCAWLQLHTIVDRTPEALDKYGNLYTIPRSLDNLSTEVFQISKATFYRTIIKPLWNHGLIDIVEWNDTRQIGTKALNIIVYHYPENNKANEVLPLKKVRDYETQYVSNAKTYGQLGGRPKEKLSEVDYKTRIIYKNDRLQARFKNKTGGVLKMKRGSVSKIKRGSVSKMKPINITNTIFNNSNTLDNSSNLLSSLKHDEEENIYKLPYKNIACYAVFEFLKEKNVSENTIFNTLKQCIAHGLEECGISEIESQYTHMMQMIDSGNTIADFPYYFANGLTKKNELAMLSSNYRNDVEEQRREWEANRSNRVEFYNWLEERE